MTAVVVVGKLEEVVGLRPGRDEIRLEVDGRIIHNYGHGGAGFLSPTNNIADKEPQQLKTMMELLFEEMNNKKALFPEKSYDLSESVTTFCAINELEMRTTTSVDNSLIVK